MRTAARRGRGSALGSPSTTIADRTRRWPTGRRWRSGAAAGNRLWTCRCAWTTPARCPHAHSHNRNNHQCWLNRSRKRCRLPPWQTHPVASGTRTTAPTAPEPSTSGPRSPGLPWPPDRRFDLPPRLSLVRNYQVDGAHWNTVYLDRAVQQLRVQGDAVPDNLWRMSPRSAGSTSR